MLEVTMRSNQIPVDTIVEFVKANHVEEERGLDRGQLKLGLALGSVGAADVGGASLSAAFFIATTVRRYTGNCVVFVTSHGSDCGGVRREAGGTVYQRDLQVI